MILSYCRMRWTVTLGAAMALAWSAPLASAGEQSDYAKWLAEKAPSLVTVKFVLKIKLSGPMAAMAGGDHEEDSEVTGVMIDPKGLVLCANSQLGGFASMMGRLMPGGMGITANPTDIKVLIGDDTEGVEAKILARDTELDLAWIRIEEPSQAPYAHVDLTRTATPKIGDRVFSVRRLGKFFDRVAAVSEGRIGGKAGKPRDLYVPAGALAAEPGLPVFAANGSVVGVTVIQMPEEEDTDMNPMAMFGRMSDMEDMASGLILPAAEVAKATERALKSAEEEEEEE